MNKDLTLLRLQDMIKPDLSIDQKVITTAIAYVAEFNAYDETDKYWADRMHRVRMALCNAVKEYNADQATQTN